MSSHDPWTKSATKKNKKTCFGEENNFFFKIFLLKKLRHWSQNIIFIMYKKHNGNGCIKIKIII